MITTVFTFVQHGAKDKCDGYIYPVCVWLVMATSDYISPSFVTYGTKQFRHWSELSMMQHSWLSI